MLKKRKGGGASRGYKSTSEMLINYGKKPKKVKVRVKRKGKKPSYKVPKTPRVSGRGWK